MLDRETFLRPVAHRGLHDGGRRIVENTGPAFLAAIDKGYGIECDIRPAGAGLPVVFHDKTLRRLTGDRRALLNLSAHDLRAIRHRVGGEPVLTFAELLDMVSGRVPLFVEIKSEWEPPNKSFLTKVANLASAYRGPLALMSFDPAVMAVIKNLAPAIPRGIVSGSYSGPGWWMQQIGRKRSAALRNLLEAGPVAPDFYAYEVNALPTPVTEYARHVAGLPLLTWTVRTPKQRRIAAAWADAMIFEGFEP